MAPIFTNIFGVGGGAIEEYRKTEKIIAGQFAETVVLQSEFQKAQADIEKATRRFENFISINSDIQIAQDTVENRVFERRLRNRKLFTVGADALVSIPSVKLVIGETLGTGLTTPVALIVGLVFSYILLKLAIDYKNDDKQNGGSGLNFYVNRYSYIIPLALIPILSFFLIVHSPGDPANFIWIVFLGAALLLNLKAASYSDQYQMIENTVEARKEKSKLQQIIEDKKKALEEISAKMVKQMQKIELTAIDLKRKWLAIPEAKRTPEIVTLSMKYIFVLNNRIYFNQLLPIDDIVINEPPKIVGEYEDFWLKTTGVGNSLNSQQSSVNLNSTSSLKQTEIPSDQEVNLTEEEDAPSFGVAIDPSNKYV